MCISENELLKRRQQFKPGTRVKLLSMDDIQSPPPGTIGTVTRVDDMGTIHVWWESGSGLGIIPEYDAFKILDQN